MLNFVLFTLCRHSNGKVRKTTAKFICTSVENYGHSKLMHANKDLLERTLVAVVQLAGDSVPETRYYARCCLNQLWPLPEFDSAVSRLLSDQMKRRAKEAVDILKTKVCTHSIGSRECVCVLVVYNRRYDCVSVQWFYMCTRLYVVYKLVNNWLAVLKVVCSLWPLYVYMYTSWKHFH